MYLYQYVELNRHANSPWPAQWNCKVRVRRGVVHRTRPFRGRYHLAEDAIKQAAAIAVSYAHYTTPMAVHNWIHFWFTSEHVQNDVELNVWLETRANYQGEGANRVRIGLKRNHSAKGSLDIPEDAELSREFRTLIGKGTLPQNTGVVGLVFDADGEVNGNR